MRDIALVPVKTIAEAKKRLSNYLAPDERRKLVRSMLVDVLHALDRSGSFKDILVISPDPSVARITEQNHAVFLQQVGSGLNSAVYQATRWAVHNQVSSVTTVLADLPLVEAKDFEEFEQISRTRPRVVMAPSLKGGTNLMLRTPPDVIQTSYGRWSYAKHLRAAQKKGIPAYSISNPRLSFDLDTIADLKALKHLDPAEKSSAGKLARELGRLHPIARPS